ncbi:HAUS augmin-like complex subunit 5 [Xenopus tropicalis]|uniref:HAUS augmin-like complex subunit 5 n=1 Tax=Xenopus tropicalis TaxID=8364 RepID=B1WAV3_XENTR|nr:HAUS augmin-like complex subunit 5 [Xenopus tropicalis]AAI61513.1 LOC100145714 protein [Xenopus tropicalis]|eukprot:NP_001120560.1 HAUS augmin-like complex subunit 5 [Xenopus tropicalis]
MERRGLAQELRRWAVEEMGLPALKAPSEEMLQRLFIGQCGDIWKFIIRHVHSQRTVRKIEGNLLWYQQLQHTEAQRTAEEEQQQRRKQLCKEILELRAELQHLQEQIQSAEREIVSQDLNCDRAQDLCRRSLLLRAFNKKREVECESLCQSNKKIQFRCEQLQEIRRASQREVMFTAVDPDLSSSTFLEPEVMRDVREACQLRFKFLRSLHDDSISSSVHPGKEDLRSLSHQQWMSMAEKVWKTHTPHHIVAALERLTVNSTQELKKLQSSLAADLSKAPSQQPKESSEPTAQTSERSHQDPKGTLPSFHSLIQEGWANSVKVSSELRRVQSQAQALSEHLAERIQEIHKKLSDGSEVSALTRVAFDAELRCVILRGCRDALLHECRILQEEAAGKKQEVKLLQQQQQNIQEACLLLDKKQKQIQILIKGNSSSKSQIRRSSAEAQKYVQDKLLPRPQEIVQESQRLQDSIQKEVKHFSAISLPAILKVSTDGFNLVPSRELSINRMSNTHAPYYGIFKGIYESLRLPLYKAPESVLSHVADMKKQLFFLRSQLSSRSEAISKIQRALRKNTNPDTDALLKSLSAHYSQQIDEMVPKLQHLIQQCEKRQEYGREVQATVMDWWEQPVQLCLPSEQRGGLTLRQWRERWTVAVTALQRATGSRS